jgi:dATP/dGTP diphosphohydrolase
MTTNRDEIGAFAQCPECGQMQIWHRDDAVGLTCLDRDCLHVLTSLEQTQLFGESKPKTVVVSGKGEKFPYANPKDIVGSGKLPLHLVPDTGVALEALAFAEGALKYGAYNWRVAPVRASIYVAALRRHLTKWLNGEEADAKSGVPHLASARACLAIILDAQAHGTLIDDRPPSAPELVKLIDEDAIKVLENLQELYGHNEPHHHTIGDGK